MADKRLRALLEFAVQGDKRAQQALLDLAESGEQVEKGTKQGARGIGIMDTAMGNWVAGNLLKAQSAIVQFGKDSLQAASDVEQMQGKFDTVFGEQSAAVEAQIESMTKAVKRSKFEWMGYAATLQDTFVPLGFAREEAAKMSVQLVALAEDLASFNNLRTEDVVRDLQSALVGNTETLRKYGVVAQETQIKQKALELGIWDGKGAIDAQAKAATILQLTIEGTADAQGAAARESDSYESSIRALEAAMLDLQVAIGEKLLPTAAKLATVLTESINLATLTADWNDLRSQLIDAGASWADVNRIVDGGRAKIDLWRTSADMERDLARNEKGIIRFGLALDAVNHGLEVGTEEFFDYIDAGYAAYLRAEGLNRIFGEEAISAEDAAKAVDIWGQAHGRAADNAGEFGDKIAQTEAQLSDYEAALRRKERATEDSARADREAGEALDEFRARVDEAKREILGLNTAITDPAKARAVYEVYVDANQAKAEAAAVQEDLSNIAGFWEAEVQARVNPEGKRDVSAMSDDLDNIAAFWEAEVNADTDDAQTRAENLHTELDQISTAEGLQKWAAKFDTYDAVRAMEDEVFPLHDAAKQFRDDAPYEALFVAETVEAEMGIQRLEDLANEAAGNYNIHFNITSSGGIPEFQHGGPISAGTVALVGEAGPELFVAPANGQIVPNNQLGTGGGRNFTWTGDVVINAGGQMIRNPDMLARQVAVKLGEQMKG